MKKSFRGFNAATIAAIKARIESGATIPYKKDLPKKNPTITIGIDPAARKKGVLQRLIFFECENSYLIWVNDDLIFSKKWGHSEGVERV